MTESGKILLDASAYIAWIGKESGYDLVEAVIHKSMVTTVTYAEIISFYAKLGLEDSLLKDLCQCINIIDVNQEICLKAGEMIKISQKYGLSLGDRLCLSAAAYYKFEVYTADKIWLQLANKLKLKITLIR
jgi:PIN domain nuclease of toxin-antitoxin system